MTKPPEPVVTGELKPCPFCGCAAKADTEESDDVGGFFVSCTKCGASVWGVEKGEAIAAWNTRTAHALPGDVGMREAAARSVATVLFGPGFDPFLSPESWDYCEMIAAAALTPSALSGDAGEE